MTMIQRISVPEAVRSGELSVVASVSGGKDSTALILALREAEVPSRYVFADTGWEAPETYAYLDTLRRILGIAIDVVGVEGGMVGKIRKRAGFPTRLGRWCTTELKVEPQRAYHDALVARGIETVAAMGIRAEESEARARMPAFELEESGYRSWGGWLWRPLLAWTIADVIAIHHRHDVPLNPLYLRGHDRVGCYPCIFSSKNEIRLIGNHAPERVDEIAAIESECAALRVARNEEHVAAGNEDPRYAFPQHATFFQTKHGVEPMGIRSVVEWSRTSRGGRQLQLLAEPPTGGCMRWGMCEPPTKAGSEGNEDEEDEEDEGDDR